MEQEPRTTLERAVLLLRAALVPGWKPTASQLLVWVIRGGIVLGILVLIAAAVDKTLWAWLQLLIIPAVLAGGGIWFNQRKQAHAQEAENQRAQNEALQAYLEHMTQLLADPDRPLYRAQPDDEYGARSSPALDVAPLPVV